MSSLSNEINEYSPEVHIDFSDASPSFNPTNYGSISLGAWAQSGSNITSSTTGGPVGGNGYYSIGNTTRYQNTTSAFCSAIADRDYVFGIWFNFPTLPTGSQVAARTILGINPTPSAAGFQLDMAGSGATGGAASKLSIAGASTSRITIANTISANTWYYVAVSRNGNSSGNYKVYLNGSLVSTSTQTSGTTISDINIGNTLSGASQVMRFSNFHVGTNANFTASAIAAIYSAGLTAESNINFSAAPATASSLFVDPTLSAIKNVNYEPSSIITTALMTEPTIVILNYDNVEVVTSILVNAEFPNATVSVQTNITNSAEPMTASAEMGTHNSVAGTGVIYLPEEATASALFVTPPYAGSADRNVTPEPLTATALIADATKTGPVNYRHLVKQYNPSFFLTNPEDVDPANPQSETYNFVNDGYEVWGSEGAGEQSSTIQAISAPSPMNGIGNGKAIFKTTTSGDNSIDILSEDAENRAAYFHTVGNSWTLEYWYYPLTFQDNVTFLDLGDLTFKHTSTARQDTTYTGTNQFGVPTQYISYKAYRGLAITLGDQEWLFNRAGQRYARSSATAQFPSPTQDNENNAESAANAAPMAYQTNQWTQLVANGTWSGNNLTVSFYTNGAFVGSVTETVLQANIGAPAGIILPIMTDTGASANKRYLNQTALYKTPLTNTAIQDHYIHIATSSPNRILGADLFESAATMVNPMLAIQSNVVYPETPVTASSLFVDPTVVAAININNTATALTASSEAIEPFFYGNPNADIVADPAIATADIPPNIYRLDTAYYSYVQTNIAPFRYVTFDVPNSNLDWGSDNDFGSAAPFTYGGSVSLAIDGLSNNSLLTNGTNYTTSGLIMKESEHDDNWGTLAKNWHTSFWIKKDHTDTNANGLRIIANLHSYENNKHLIVYQYNNYLYLQLDDKVHTPETFQSSVNVNVFDGNKHHIVIGSRSNNTIHIYKNKILVLDVSVTNHVVTTNSATSWAANTETNNKARFAVGALITPYAETNLVTTPTTSTMYIDEAHWAVTTINQTGVNNLYAAMPFKVEIEWFADPALSTTNVFVDPTFGTGVGNVAGISTASSLFVNPVVSADYEIVYSASPATASALAVQPFSVVADNITNKTVISDTFVASAEMRNAVIVISIPAQAMTATARMASSAPYYDEYNLLILKQSRLPLGTAYAGRWSVGDVDS